MTVVLKTENLRKIFGKCVLITGLGLIWVGWKEYLFKASWPLGCDGTNRMLGCFVMAKEARMAIFDRVFVRIGARDSLVEGKSTFWVEMEETKHILDNATD